MSKYRNLISKTELFEKLALYGSRGSFLNRLAQMSKEPVASMPETNVSQGPAAVQAPAGTVDANGVMVMQPDHITGKAPPKYPTIPTTVQESLNFLAGEANAPLPKNKKGNYVNADGLLGPETRAALNWFATANGLVGKSDKELFAAVAEKQREAVSNATKQLSPSGPVA